MTIVIPEDENINEIVIDVRDVLAGVELQFDAEKEFQTVFTNRNELYNNAFVSEFVFTIQKSDFDFPLNEDSFIQNLKKVGKKIKAMILDILNLKFRKMRTTLKGDIEKNYYANKKNEESKSFCFNRRFLKHIKEQYCNIVDSTLSQIIIMKKGEKVILGEKLWKSSVQLVAVSSVNTGKKLGLDNNGLKNVKITEVGMCPENLLEASLENVMKDKKASFKFNRYIENRLKTKQDEIEM